MERGSVIPYIVIWISALVLTVASALFYTATAFAQPPGTRSVEFQYQKLQAPPGPMVGETLCNRSNNPDGTANPGDTFTLPSGFAISPGASITLRDRGGTQGTLIDGENAEITDGTNITVTARPMSVSGGDGRLSDEACEEIVASTGIASEGREATPTLSALPLTGGSLIIFVLGAFLVSFVGFVALRRSVGVRRKVTA